MQKCQVSLLQSYHDKTKFCCGNQALDHYFKELASQDVRRHATAVYVLTEVESHSVQGFYTLSAQHIKMIDLSIDLLKQLPRYPLLPVTFLGRLALNQKFQGEGWGSFLLMDALRRSLSLSESIGSVGVIVEAKNAEATSFYKHYGFELFHGRDDRLFISMKTIAKFIFTA